MLLRGPSRPWSPTILMRMSAQLIDGKQLSFTVRRQVARRVAEARRTVRLDAVIAGEDKGADIYLGDADRQISVANNGPLPYGGKNIC